MYPILDQLWFESLLPEAKVRPGEAITGRKMRQDVTSLLGDGSWRKMLLTQPPNPDLGISAYNTRNSSSGTIMNTRLSCPTDGITLGEVVDKLFGAAVLVRRAPLEYWTVLISAGEW
jgi:hypothetical protein